MNNPPQIGHSENMKRKSTADRFTFYVLLFFVTAFAGWLWEVLLFFFTEHAFINRGVYEGPYLPIYGAGGLLLCMLLHRLSQKPLSVFALSMLICTILEYLTSFFLERKWGIRWWDYSGHFLNLNGESAFWERSFSDLAEQLWSVSSSLFTKNSMNESLRNGAEPSPFSFCWCL